jgi:phosphatidylserine/phosphatidylglycerophosphate/cardiolipin synthase-like enzyme
MTRKSSRKGVGLLGWLARAGVVTIFLAIAGVVFLYEQGDAPPTEEPATRSEPTNPGRTAVSAGLIKAYFTTPTLIYPDRRDQRPDSPLLKAVIADIGQAERTVDLAVFDIDLRDLTDALLAAKKRDVTVRLVVDSENLIAPEVAEVTGQMQQAGIAITFDERSAFMHNKFIVIDRRVLWLGSWNMTTNDTYRNNNNMLRLRSQLAADAYQKEFQAMFDGQFGTRKPIIIHPAIRLDETPIDLHFSPTDGVAQYILTEIGRARRSIQFMAFSFTSDDIASAMVDRRSAGLSVQGVMERQNVEGTGAAFQQLDRGGVEVLEDGNCYILHHKVIIIDEQIVITGSYNFTNSAEQSNDENLVIIADKELAAQYIAEFERVWEQAQAPTRCG